MRQVLAVLAGSAIALASANVVSAMPAFARRYGVECHMCHQGFPKLNKTGQRFKERGFRLEDEDAFTLTDWLKSVPLRARVSGQTYRPETGDSASSAFVKLMAAGNLGPRVSYWADSGFLFDDFDETKTYQEPTDAWVRLELLPEGKLYARAGRFELDLPFTQTRSPHLFSYSIYHANTGGEIDGIAAYQHGVEVGGLFGGETYHWSAAVTSGAEDDAGEALFEPSGQPDPTGDFEWNLFLRAARRGDSYRFGAFSYLGRNTLATAGAGARPQTWQNGLVRVGLDADLWPTSKLNLYGLYMYGRNSDSLPAASGVGGSGQRGAIQGGFVQADYHAVEKHIDGFLKEVALALTLRANYVRAGAGSRETATSVYPGVRFWLRERFRLSFEHGFEGQGRGDISAVQAELVF